MAAWYLNCEAVPSGFSSGQYWVDPDGSGEEAFVVWCDQETEGGGWTLVYSYEVTRPMDFSNEANSVIPIPNWNWNTMNIDATLLSTNTPTTEDSLGAMPFNKWSSFGETVLIKSSTNHWMVCAPQVGQGDFLRLLPGRMLCRIVLEKRARNCAAVPESPFYLSLTQCGLHLYHANAVQNTIYHWDGCTVRGVPTHDPCGQRRSRNVDEVKGWIYVRTNFI